ncbi:MAG: TonB-dependent receptor [Ignavibacteriales bacterium]|nr:TonB-dependent receptor [Ignavibacteriales bacterium]
MSVVIQAGETGKIAGRITDKTTGQPLTGATVILFSKFNEGTEEKLVKPIGAASDESGNFYILSVPSGLYNVKCTYIGYHDEIITKVKVSIDRTTRVDINLTTKALETGEVIITAYSAKKVEIDLTATKQTYEVEQVREIAGVQDVSDILALQPDVVDDHFRGGRLGQSSYLIGGSTIVNPLSNQRAFSPIVTGLKTVEVLTSGFSAEYGNAQSGVVNMIPKEGGETWKTTLDFSGAFPYYKTWNGSPYQTKNLQFFNLLRTYEEWLTTDPVTGKPLWDLGYSFSNYAKQEGGDTAKTAYIARHMFMQGMRDVGMEYDDDIDSRVDFTIGGPLTESIRLFVTGRQRETAPSVPTASPNLARQIMGNIYYQPTPTDKIGFRFIWDSQFENQFSASNFLRFLFNRSLGMTKFTSTTYQFGFDWKTVINNSLVFESKLNIMDVLSQTRIELIRDNEYIYTYSNQSNWGSFTAPSQNTFVQMPDDKGKDKVRTYDFHSSVNYQVNEFNLLKVGLQYAYNQLDVNRDMNVVNDAAYRKVQFKVNPYEGGIYLQDKMEFEGFIANIGLRMDYYNMNSTYYNNLYSPLKNPFYDETKPLGQRGKYYDPDLALKTKTKLYTKIQPRVGLSFPVSESSVFHINYGTFTQRPSYEQIFYNQITKSGQIEIMGNPRLKPENTNMYDIGIVNAFPEGIKLDVSAYYKDIKDLVESATYFDKQQQGYKSYTNRDYSDVKGFFITVEKLDENLEVFARYNYESATGKSSNEFDAPITYYEAPPEGQTEVVLPAAEDIYMNYDRTHKLVANVRFRINENESEQFFGFEGFDNTSFSITFRYYTGRPYTYNTSGEGLRYNMRTPSEYDLRVRLQKKVKIVQTNVTCYLEGFNLLNRKIYNYSGVFNNEENKNHYQRDPGTIETFVPGGYTALDNNPYTSNQSLYIYQNQPINFRLGVILSF